MSLRSTLLASAVTLALIVASYAAHAGQYRLAPGAQANIDVSSQGSYTSIIVANTGSQPGSIELDAPVGRKLELAPGQSTEIYGPLRSRGFVSVRNTGSSPLTVTSSYQDRAPAP
ncbi:hypothetical protein [Ferrovibrio sp.]|uniref:hypothetical protein n=1 Tax=Ferrovibrio sp. TaxID=1917215 RepID=UPI001B5D912B|nr:hypothetical protein [Ferrovibrio sp.]MBP7064507.1 hypothetical protein [Ferrovibrio sp.]